MSITHEKNATAGKAVRLICENCKIEQQHVVVKSVRKVEDYDYETAHTEYEIVKCINCDQLSFRKEYSSTETYFYDEYGDAFEYSDVEVFPSRTAGRFKLKNYEHLPISLRMVYEELVQVLNGGQRTLASLGVRVLIEQVCSDKNATGKNLYEKIDNLVEQNVLTNDGAKILHRLRVLGNTAAHEAYPGNSEQLDLAMDVVENLLTSVYIHPRIVDAVFPKQAKES